MCSYMLKSRETFGLFLFIRASILIMRAVSSWPNTITLGFNIWISRPTYIQVKWHWSEYIWIPFRWPYCIKLSAKYLRVLKETTEKAALESWVLNNRHLICTTVPWKGSSHAKSVSVFPLSPEYTFVFCGASQQPAELAGMWTKEKLAKEVKGKEEDTQIRRADQSILKCPEFVILHSYIFIP